MSTEGVVVAVVVVSPISNPNKSTSGAGAAETAGVNCCGGAAGLIGVGGGGAGGATAGVVTG